MIYLKFSTYPATINARISIAFKNLFPDLLPQLHIDVV